MYCVAVKSKLRQCVRFTWGLLKNLDWSDLRVTAVHDTHFWADANSIKQQPDCCDYIMNSINDPLLCGYLHEMLDFNASDIRRFPQAIYPLIYKFIAPLDLKGMLKYLSDTKDDYKVKLDALEKAYQGEEQTLHSNMFQKLLDAEFEYEEEIQSLLQNIDDINIEKKELLAKVQQYELKIKALESQSLETNVWLESL